MKRTAWIATVALLALAVAGCGGDGDKSSSGTTATGTGNGSKALKIGLVTDTGQLNDRGFNHLAYVGLKRAEKELGVEVRVYESNSNAEYIPNLSRFAQLGYDLIIGVGFTETSAMDTVATKFPDQKFAIIDVANADMEHHPQNVVGLLFKEQEVGYLAGYLAGLEAKRKGATLVSSVGGQKQPPVDRFIAGYQAGATKAFPGVTTRNNYSEDFDDQAKCKEIALNQIAAGSAVIFQVAGGCGLGALDAAKEKDVWGVGVDADQAFLGPHILTSAMKGVDTAVFDTIKSVQDGTYKGGEDKVFGLAEKGVGLGKISPQVPKSEVDAVRKLADGIAAGKAGPIPTTVK
ncbi:MAG: BMP family ABC transporter substrate-binding protein [Actinomycetota bacterium]|nr:BMP family ABC transporter substrate-binding protein [Actinomycetota bacterium]